MIGFRATVRGILEGISDGVADNGGRMQRRALFLKIDLNNLFGIVPASTCIRHENSLEESEDCDRDQIADEERRGFGSRHRSGEERKGKRKAEYRYEDVDHSLLRILCADLDDFLGILGRGTQAGGIIQLDILFDVLDGPVCARGDGLRGGTRKPVDNRATAQESQQRVWIEKI